MNEYQREQLAAWQQIEQALEQMTAREKDGMRRDMGDYLHFREEVDSYLNLYFNKLCTASCYQNKRSACCSKDGILTFWADLVIEALTSGPSHLKNMIAAIRAPEFADKCIYLTSGGCRWQVNPLVCLMFLCDSVQQEVFSRQPEAARLWENLCARARGFRWPDHSVLFDRLEAPFLDLDCFSPLMYLHTSPGLMRIKKKAGLY